MSIKAEFKWSKDIYKTAGEITYKYMMKYSYKKYIGYLFIGLILLGLYREYKFHDLSALYLGVILSIYWYYIRAFLYKKRLDKGYKKEGIDGINMHFNISKGGININGNMIPWRDISLAIIEDRGIVLKRAEGYPFLPVNSFKSQEDIEEFINLLGKNRVKVVLL